MIPDYQTLMLPLLNLLSDGNVHPNKILLERLAEQFDLSPAERQELLPSGKQALFQNRVGWARTYLKKAGLLDAPQRATSVITEEGRRVLAGLPREINTRFLQQFPAFQAFRRKSAAAGEQQAPETTDGQPDSRTPEEIIDDAYQMMRDALASELLQRIMAQPPAFFEQLVVDLLVRMGYGGSRRDAGSAIGRSGDEGIDGIIKEDRLGLDVLYLQAKRWKPGTLVGRPELQKFVGALAGQGAKKGIFITTAGFTRDALTYSPKNETNIVLIDGNQLSQLMIDYNLGCSVKDTFELKQIDNDYFGEE